MMLQYLLLPRKMLPKYSQFVRLKMKKRLLKADRKLLIVSRQGKIQLFKSVKKLKVMKKNYCIMKIESARLGVIGVMLSN